MRIFGIGESREGKKIRPMFLNLLVKITEDTDKHVDKGIIRISRDGWMYAKDFVKKKEEIDIYIQERAKSLNLDIKTKKDVEESFDRICRLIDREFDSGFCCYLGMYDIIIKNLENLIKILKLSK